MNIRLKPEAKVRPMVPAAAALAPDQNQLLQEGARIVIAERQPERGEAVGLSNTTFNDGQFHALHEFHPRAADKGDPMTTDSERWDNVDSVRTLLWDIIERKITPGEVRKRAIMRIRNFPDAQWVEQQRLRAYTDINFQAPRVEPDKT